MPGGRSSTPLFEVLSRGDAAHHDDRPANLPPHEGPDNHHDDHDVHARRGRVLVPIPTLYAAGALTLSLLVLAFVGGYQYGQSAATDATQPLDLNGVIRPPNDPANTRITDPTVGPRRQPADQPTPSRATQQPGAANSGILSAEGPLQADPREPGSNYLELATLTQTQAVSALDFLAANNLRAIAVPVGLDRPPSASNTSDRFRIVSLGLAVPSGAYSRMAGERRSHEALVARLGKRWVTEAGGTADFSDTLWKKYDP